MAVAGGGTLSFAGAARVRAGLCVVGGAAHAAASSVHMLVSPGDARGGAEADHTSTAHAEQASGAVLLWQRCPLPRTPRVHAAVAALSGNVYVLVSCSPCLPLL